MNAARPLDRTREPGFYWVRTKGKRGQPDPQMGRFITEPWVGITPWRIDGVWYGEREVDVLGARLIPPAEEPSR